VARILLLGEYHAERIVSALREYGHADIVICGFHDVSGHVGGVRHRDLPSPAGVDDILALLDEEAPDLVLPNVYPRGQEQMLTTYAEVAQRWGGVMPVHSPEFAELACDKVAFHLAAVRRGWPVPEGTVCHDGAELTAAAAFLGLPVMVKEARTQPVEGCHLVRSREALDDIVAATSYPVVAQRVCHGDEVGAELLSMAGQTVRWPLASFGTLPKYRGPGRRVRMAPYRLAGRALRTLEHFVDDLTAAYRVHGSWQVDLAVAGDQLSVLEVNGRLSGMSKLSHLVSTVDPHRAFVAACFGVVEAPPPPRYVSMELPIGHDGHLPEAPPGVRYEVDTGSPTDRCLLTADYRWLRLQAGPSSPVLDWLYRFRHLLRVPFHEIEERFA
jgi:carbamoylphosphate synthase large subunit